jgi:hypothetical protein
MSVSPKFSPPQFNNPLIDQKTGLLTEYWQRWIISLVQRLEGPIVSTPPATSATPGTPFGLATDGTYLYINIDGATWKRITLVTF